MKFPRPECARAIFPADTLVALLDSPRGALSRKNRSNFRTARVDRAWSLPPRAGTAARTGSTRPESSLICLMAQCSKVFRLSRRLEWLFARRWFFPDPEYFRSINKVSFFEIGNRRSRRSAAAPPARARAVVLASVRTRSSRRARIASTILLAGAYDARDL